MAGEVEGGSPRVGLMPWEGSCNRCGLCCTKIVGGVPTRCENLVIRSSSEAVCSVWNDRTPWMPIALVDANGRVLEWSHCQMAYPYDLHGSHVIPDKCGYRWVQSDLNTPKT